MVRIESVGLGNHGDGARFQAAAAARVVDPRRSGRGVVLFLIAIAVLAGVLLFLRERGGARSANLQDQADPAAERPTVDFPTN